MLHTLRPRARSLRRCAANRTMAAAVLACALALGCAAEEAADTPAPPDNPEAPETERASEPPSATAEPEPAVGGPIDPSHTLDLDGFEIRVLGVATFDEFQLGNAGAAADPEHTLLALRLEVTRTGDTAGIFAPAEFLHLRSTGSARDTWLGSHHGCQVALPQSMVREVAPGDTVRVNACWHVPADGSLELGVTRNLYAAAEASLDSRWTVPAPSLALADLVPQPVPIALGAPGSLHGWTIGVVGVRRGETLRELGIDDDDPAGERIWVALDLEVGNDTADDRAALPVQLRLATPTYELWEAPALPCMQSIAAAMPTTSDDQAAFPAGETVPWRVCFAMDPTADAEGLALDALVGLAPEPGAFLRFEIPGPEAATGP